MFNDEKKSMNFDFEKFVKDVGDRQLIRVYYYYHH